MNQYKIRLSTGLRYETNGFDDIASVLYAIKDSFAGGDIFGDGLSVMSRRPGGGAYNVEINVIINPMHVMSIEENPRS